MKPSGALAERPIVQEVGGRVQHRDGFLRTDRVDTLMQRVDGRGPIGGAGR
jgi:hypothetical protein